MIQISFSRNSSHRDGATEIDLGRFEWVQLTYEDLTVAPDGDIVAFYDKSAGYWTVLSTGETFSDITLSPVRES